MPAGHEPLSASTAPSELVGLRPMLVGTACVSSRERPPVMASASAPAGAAEATVLDDAPNSSVPRATEIRTPSLMRFMDPTPLSGSPFAWTGHVESNFLANGRKG